MTTDNGDNNARERLGTVGKLDDGRTYVQFVRRVRHPPEAVWAAITEPERLADWFPGFQVERQAGGVFQIWFDGDCDGPAHVEGTVSRFEPPHVLELGSMRWELVADGGGCIVTFRDILHFQGPLTKTEFTNSVLGGWHHYMDMLENVLDGRPVDLDALEFDYASVDIPGRE